MLGDPVLGENFFNREKELALISRRLSTHLLGNRRNLAIIGLRKVGKTSLLLESMRRMEGDNLIPVYIYLPEREGNIFIKKSIAGLFYCILKKRHIDVEIRKDARELILDAIKICPDAVKTALDVLSQVDNDLDEAFRGMLQIFSIVKNELGVKILIVFDEFQRLTDYSIQAPIDTFREHVMFEEDIWYIIAGSAIGMMNQIVNSSNSPLYGHFEIMQLRGFNFADSRKFLLSKLEGKQIGEGNISFLIDITNGIPYYLDLLSFRIKDVLEELDLSKVSRRSIVDAISLELFSTSGAIYNHLNSFIINSLNAKGFGTYIQILEAIAEGHHRITDLSKKTRIPQTSFPRLLNRLIECDIVRKHENAYYLIDTMLSLWMKYVYSLREQSFISELELKFNLFKSQVEQMIQTHKREIGLGNEARIRELFFAFDSKLKLHGKILPKFDSVIQETINDNEFDIVAKYNERYWIAEVKDKIVDKDIVVNFDKKVAKLDRDVEEKICICLSTVDYKAQEEMRKREIQLWTLSDVNMLMKLYSKFRILM